MGYPVPEGRTFYSDAWCRRRRTRDDIAAGYRYARDYLGFPVVVKPNTGSFGAGVATVGNRRQFYRAMRTVFDELGGHVALVQRVAEGSDYRIAVLDDDVIAAYRRRPLSVTGDGRHTIMELCERKLDALSRQGRPLHIEPEDPRISCRLERMQLSPHHVLPGGTDVFLLDNANLSTGGDAVDVTEHIHPEFRGLAVRIARDIGLRFCGIDLVTSSSLQESPIGYTVLEVNAAPLFDHFVTLGEAQQRRVEAIYGRILQAMVNR
jgi:D-alanine-D-alanine ligase-like ATP-grasp enzyme